MTQQRIDDKSTEFGLWLRKQKEIDSDLGYLATNIDYMWKNYNSDYWMLIEEKRKCTEIKNWQNQMFETLDKAIIDKNYKGFHKIIFENTCPEDGKIWLDTKLITKEQLIEFLRFRLKIEDIK